MLITVPQPWHLWRRPPRSPHRRTAPSLAASRWPTPRGGDPRAPLVHPGPRRPRPLPEGGGRPPAPKPGLPWGEAAAAPTRSGPRRSPPEPAPPRRIIGAFPLPPPAGGAGRWRRAAAALSSLPLPSPQRRAAITCARPRRRRHLQRPPPALLRDIARPGAGFLPPARPPRLLSTRFMPVLCPFYTRSRRVCVMPHGSSPTRGREAVACALRPVRGHGQPAGWREAANFEFFF